ncbi:hypothetical protein MKY34_15340 [Sporosarcina sp. FSL K6-1522]|uniref:hypothetical protein n=1 Tax=Sporosarcina sp. FSL K6-1522 TaxID=2921554 RepID=UPI00315A16AB
MDLYQRKKTFHLVVKEFRLFDLCSKIKLFIDLFVEEVLRGKSSQSLDYLGW